MITFVNFHTFKRILGGYKYQIYINMNVKLSINKYLYITTQEYKILY